MLTKEATAEMMQRARFIAEQIEGAPNDSVGIVAIICNALEVERRAALLEASRVAEMMDTPVADAIRMYAEGRTERGTERCDSTMFAGTVRCHCDKGHDGPHLSGEGMAWGGWR